MCFVKGSSKDSETIIHQVEKKQCQQNLGKKCKKIKSVQTWNTLEATKINNAENTARNMSAGQV